MAALPYDQTVKDRPSGLSSIRMSREMAILCKRATPSGPESIPKMYTLYLDTNPFYYQK